MKKLNLIMLLSLMLFALVGCSEENKEAAEPMLPEEVPTIEWVEGTNTDPVLADEGGELQISFEASGTWSARVDAIDRTVDWISVSPTDGGKGKHQVTVTVQPNEEYDERNAALTISCGDEHKTLTITQKQKNALMVSSGKVELDATGGEFCIELQANVSVDYEIEAQAADWLSVSSETRGLVTSTLNFRATENTGTDTRQGVITLKGGNLTEKVTVHQTGNAPAIILSQKEYVIPSAGETICIELKSNTDYTVRLPDVDWISEVQSRAFSAYTHYFIVDSNEAYDARTAEILFVDKANGVEEKVSVIQMQKNAIVVAQPEYTVESDGGTLNFTVNSNVDFMVKTSADWIQQVETRGMEESTLRFNIAANEQTTEREGVITLQSLDYNIEQHITVRQSAASCYMKILSAPAEELTAEEQEFKVKVETNAEWLDVSAEDAWVWCVNSYQEDTYTFIYVFRIERNENDSARMSHIVFRNVAWKIEERVAISQKGIMGVDMGIEDLPTQEW